MTLDENLERFIEGHIFLRWNAERALDNDSTDRSKFSDSIDNERNDCAARVTI